MNNRVSWFYVVGRWIMLFLLWLLTSWKVRGRENVPRKGAFLVVSNHMNLADPPLIAVSIPRRTIFMAKEELFRPRLTGYFVARFGSFPVYRKRLDLAAMRKARELLDEGWALVMFPEGMRSQNGELLPAFPGSAIIAARSDVPILPVAITGTEKLKGKTWIFKRPKVQVNIGKPFTLPHNGRVNREQISEMSDNIMCRIAELLPLTYRGCYVDRVDSYADRKVD